MSYVVQDLKWFQQREGKIVYRTSLYDPKLIYKLQMMRYTPEELGFDVYVDEEDFKKRSVDGEIYIEVEGGSIKQKYIKVVKVKDNRNAVDKDIARQHNSQFVWGFRFFDTLPRGFNLSSFDI